MYFLKFYFAISLLFLSLFSFQKVFADQTVTISVCMTSNDCSYKTPAQLADLNTSSDFPAYVEFTFLNVSIPSITDTVSPTSSPQVANWGLFFTSTSTSSYPDTTCLGSSCTDTSSGSSNVTVTPDITDLTSTSTTTSGTTTYAVTGTLVVKLTWSSIPTNLQNLLNDTKTSTVILSIKPVYKSLSNSTLYYGSANEWKADTGAFLNAPVISATPQDGAFVVSLNAPSDSSAAQPDSIITPTSLSSGGTNSVTGYIVAYWKDTECNNSNYIFTANPVDVAASTYYSGSSSAVYTCIYTPYQSSFGTGASSSALGCVLASGILMPINGSTPTADQVAIPYLSNNSNPYIPITTGSTTNGCVHYAYVSSSQSSWSVTGIKNDDVYGVTVWALNAGSPTPTYSIEHSNIVYVAGVSLGLASLEKDSSLPLVKADCFVVTAASGNVNSLSVFYWRILRDKYLTPIGFTPFYYQHAHAWAAWLNKHPALKSPLNFILEKSGYGLYHTGEFLEDSFSKIKIKAKKFTNWFLNITNQTAGAKELQNKITQKEEQNTYKQPHYEVAITSGILFPTEDKALYDKYYHSTPSYHIELSSSILCWSKNWGYSVGLLGRYLGNTQNDTAKGLGNSDISYQRSFYALSAEIISALRYRDPNFLYIQPSIYIGAGLVRFREEATVNDSPVPTSSSGSVETLGISTWSPIFEFGENIDFSLMAFTPYDNASANSFLQDLLFRTSASYNWNPNKALSSTGIFIQGGFVFLLK